ncbi:hypothetical protein HMI54_012697 [Coelomomyces lativittatus]|nr:hypothetical protein HMI56_001879 [Coelomomyces lativittatus]KAJ1517417.1 hypothetical protein HMI55_007145 [Coelomomyces lativittatus]KAJ1518666.1 hypothetical protein HMI54_012697 [Coelomomyces lativittatus]
MQPSTPHSSLLPYSKLPTTSSSTLPCDFDLEDPSLLNKRKWKRVGGLGLPCVCFKAWVSKYMTPHLSTRSLSLSSKTTVGLRFLLFFLMVCGVSFMVWKKIIQHREDMELAQREELARQKEREFNQMIAPGIALDWELEKKEPFHHLLRNITQSNTYLHKVDHAPMAMTMIVSDPTSIVAKLSLRNKYMYAKKRGYSLMVRKPHLKGRSPAWSKMGAILEAFQLGYPLVWMLDLDTIITNSSISLHRLPEPMVQKYPKKSLFISKDCSDFNSGSILIRNTPWSIYCLNTLNESYNAYQLQTHAWCEQQGFIINFNSNNTWKEYVHQISDVFVNLYPGYCQFTRSWKPGDLFLHFAGMMHDNQNIDKYLYHYNATLSLSRQSDPSYDEDRYVQRYQLWIQLAEQLDTV